MTKSDLISEFAAKADININAAEAIIHEVFAAMTDAMVAGDGIEIRGFGSFTIREYDGREARNPKTGDLVTVVPKKRPFFKCGKDLKDKLTR